MSRISSAALFHTKGLGSSFHASIRLSRRPRVRWLLAHAGGTLPFLAYRTSLLQLTPAVAQNLGLRELDEQNFDYGRLFYDTALSPAPSAMQSVREVTDVSHIMFATDCPSPAPYSSSQATPHRSWRKRSTPPNDPKYFAQTHWLNSHD